MLQHNENWTPTNTGGWTGVTPETGATVAPYAFTSAWRAEDPSS